MEQKFNRRKFLEIAAASAAAASLAACTSTKITQIVGLGDDGSSVGDETQNTDQPASTTQVSGERVLNINTPFNSPEVIDNVDPGQSTQYASFLIDFMMFSGLIFLDQELKPQPDMAMSWIISEDAMTFTFKLRQDLKWDDGTPINANDFVWTLLRNISPGLPNPQAWQLMDIAGANEFYSGTSTDASTVGVKAIDDYTLEIKLAHPAVYFLNVCTLPAFMPLPKAAIEAGGNDKWTQPETVRCSGPFKLVKWDVGSRMEFVVNPNYHNDIPGVDRVIMNQITGDTEIIEAYEKSVLDIIEVPAAEYSRVVKDPVLSNEMVTTADLGIYHLVFTFLKPLDDVRVRHAIAMSIDKEALCSIVIPGLGTPAYEFLPPGLIGYDPTTGSELKYNPTQARQLIADAGYPEGEGFPDVYLFYGPNDPTDKTILESLQAMIKEAINVTMVLAPSDQVLAGDKPSIGCKFWGADYPDSHDFMALLYTCPPVSDTNRYGKTDLFYCSAMFDDLVSQAAAEVDSDKRAALYKQCEQELIVDNPAVIPLYYSTRTRLVKPYVKDLIINGSGAPSFRSIRIDRTNT
jgi:oligopeptide transport system substrate-binding protein